MKIRRGFADENGDGVFELLALLLKKNCLCARGIEKSFFLGDIEAGSDSALVAGIDKIETLGKGLDSAVQNAELGVHLAKREIVAGEFRGNDEARVFEIGASGLIGSLGRFYRTAASAEEVRFIAYGERQGVGGLRKGHARNRSTDLRPIAGKALARGGRRRTELRKLSCNLNGSGGTSLLEMSGGDFQSLIRAESIFYERIEHVVVKNGPPFALGKCVLRDAFAERLGDVPVRGNGGGSALVFRADGAAGEERRDAQ